MTKNI